MIQEKRLVDQFADYVAIDSPSLHERQLADIIKRQLEQMGFSVSEDKAGEAIGGDCGNVYALLPGSLDLPPILFSGHFDTVEPSRGKRAVVHDNGLITSGGDTVLGADDLAALTAILEAIRSLQEEDKPHRPVELLITVAEEKHLLGSRHLEPERLTAREAYVLDTDGEPGLAINRAPGNINMVFKIRGKAAHAGMKPEEGISAITVAAKGIAAMRLGRLDDETTANIGEIKGGQATNIVAEHCIVTSECRSQTWDKMKEQADHMCDCMRQAADELGAELEIERVVSYYPYSVEAESPVLVRFQKACDELGLPFKTMGGGGGSDNNELVRHGIEGLVLATGMRNCHSTQEQIETKHLVQMANLVEKLILLP
jgi:tripeptide aminopeptidase